MTEKANEGSPDDPLLSARVSAMEGRMTLLEANFAKQTKDLAENTVSTNKVLEIITTAEGFFKVCGYIGRAAKWLLTIGTLVGALIGGFWTTWKNH